jgi:outer membrane protein assembly factor BamB
MKKLVALGGILIAISTSPGTAETIVPNPRPGTVLWKKSVDELDPNSTPILAPDGNIWGNRPWVPYEPKGIDPITRELITNSPPPFSFPQERLRSKAAFLADGTKIEFTPDGLQARGERNWLYVEVPANPTAANAITAQGAFVFKYNILRDSQIVEQHLVVLDGRNGAEKYNRLLAVAPSRYYEIFGFGPGGELLMLGEELGHYSLSSFNVETGLRIATVFLPESYKLFPEINSSANHGLPYMAITQGGLIAVGVTRRAPSDPDAVAGIYVIDLTGKLETRFVELGSADVRVTGLVALRNGLVYVSLGRSNGSLRGGGIRGVDPVNGQIVVIPDVEDSIRCAPVVAPDGTLYALGDNRFPRGDGATIYAIATGSKGGLARSTWPRSTGDNLNSFREQGVEDSDGDGLTDEEEVSNYRTDPRLTDTDGDGYSDGVEVQNASDPLNKSNIPEILEAQIAIKLSFGTNVGQRYRLQSSIDLLSWINEGEPFDGTGTRSTQLVEASRARFYWRLVKVVQ